MHDRYRTDATFALDEAKGYLKSKSDRYLGVYSGQDWKTTSPQNWLSTLTNLWKMYR